MIAGKLNSKLIAMRDRGTAEDSRGQMVPVTTSIADIWASVDALSGEEALEYQALAANISHRVLCRWSSETKVIRTDDWLLFASSTDRRLDIKAVLNVDKRDRTLEMLCGEHIDVHPVTS